MTSIHNQSAGGINGNENIIFSNTGIQYHKNTNNNNNITHTHIQKKIFKKDHKYSLGHPQILQAQKPYNILIIYMLHHDRRNSNNVINI